MKDYKVFKMKHIILVAAFLEFGFSLHAQSVKNTSYKTHTGEKVLKFETIIPVDLTTAWQWFTTDAKLQKWMAPVAHMELKTGGYIATNYNAGKSFQDSSSIRLPIINFIDNELITLKVNLNGNFSQSVIKEDNLLQEIIQFKKIDATHTKIISSMLGFGNGTDWEKTYDFFEKGNNWTYKELVNNFKNK